MMLMISSAMSTPAVGVHVIFSVGFVSHGPTAVYHVNQRRHDVLTDGQDVTFPLNAAGRLVWAWSGGEAGKHQPAE